MTMFGSPPVLLGEDEQAYGSLFKALASGLKSRGIIEQIWLNDVVDLTWEIARLRKIMTRLISDKVPDFLEGYLAPAMRNHSDDAAQKLVRKWMAGDADAKARVDKLLTQTNSTIDSIYGRALTKDIDYIERIDQMVATLERRRNSVFHEIDRHRATFSRALRDNVEQIEDAEFKEVEPKVDSPKLAIEDAAP
jgi:hypothetical protein